MVRSVAEVYDGYFRYIVINNYNGLKTGIVNTFKTKYDDSVKYVMYDGNMKYVLDDFG